jgi:starch-binding outer membrane protein, SusD/RagB family
MKYLRHIYTMLAIVSITACDDLLDLEPKGEIIADQALKTPADVQALLNSAYDVLRGTGGDFLGGRFQAIAEVMSENIDGKSGSLDNADFLAYYNKTTSFFTGYTQAMFDEPYIVIYRANVLLQSVNVVPGITDAEKERIGGEAKFLRALCYFELVRLFAQPYGYTADNSHLGVVVRSEPSAAPQNRNTVAEVYSRIVTDLTDAIEVLPGDNDVYANIWAAKAYLAKVYFHMHQFQNAFDLANDVIENGPNAFNPDNSELMNRYSPGGTDEAIFKQVSTQNDHRGPQLTTHFRSDQATPPTLRISRSMYNLATNDAADIRGQEWYTIINNGEEDERISIQKFNEKNYFDVPMITVTEMKFIRAESSAEIHTNHTVALDDLNDVRNRAGLASINTVADKQTLLNLIRVEKRKEFVAEGIHFHDLRRIGAKGENVMIRGSQWNCPGMAIQFPDGEIAGAGGTAFFTPNEEGGC